MIADKSRLELKYQYAEVAYWFIERHCHDDIEPARERQRDITRWSFEVVRGARPEVQPYTNLLIQFPDASKKMPDRIAPDSSVFVYKKMLKVGNSFDTPFQPVVPFLAMDYTKEKLSGDGAFALKVPYYLHFNPDGEGMTLFRLGEKKYTAVRTNAAKRYPIPELELEVALLDKWMRYWFRGELVPLPGDLLKERDAARQQLDAERLARQAAEAENAKLRAELAKAKRHG